MTTIEVFRKEFCGSVLKCYEKIDVTTFQKIISEQCPPDVDKKALIDQVLRDTLLIIFTSNSPENIYILELYITFCIELCRKDVANAGIPIVLLSDIFDAMTLDRCEKLFTFVENNVSIWKEDLFFGPCKNNLLRMCNDLLRRLSRSQQTVFCGRILLFLAKFFPFSERSGLNIVSEFNLDNYTEFGTEKSEEELLQEVDKTEKEKIENKIPIDYNLYRKFWALQDFFRNPNQCYNKMHWKVFAAHASSVLSVFSSFKLDDQRSCPTIGLKNECADGSHKETHYFAKYLTNQKLLELQLSDSNFRRYVLLQFLILFQYLSVTVKFKAESHELKSDQVEWVKTTTDNVYSLLGETPPDGPVFAETVKNILKREEHWNAWKNEGCPAFKRPASDSSDCSDGDEVRKPKRIRRRTGDLIKDAQLAGKYQMGNTELTKLWNLAPNNLEACKSKDRDFLPSLEAYFEEAIEQLDPAAMVEDQYKKVNDENFGWRALRLLARRSPHFFIHANNFPINKLPEYLETMIKKIAKEKPTQQDVKTESDETIPSDNADQEYNILKQETEQVEPDTPIIKNEKGQKISSDLVAKLSEVLKNDWKKLATKFGYRSDEIEFFEGKPTQYEQCKSMLEIWAEEADDASIENLTYILEELKCTEALTLLK